MADTKITALAPIGAIDPANDVLPIVDVSNNSMAASGTTCRVTTNQLLQANAIASLASATISGDLTVDTSTLKVDSANNRVIVGHTSGSSAFQVTNAGAAGFEVQPTGVNSAPAILSYNRSSPAWLQLTYGASSHVFQLSGTDGMTLNATGLGIGTSSPAAALDLTNTGITASREIRIENSAVRTFIGVEGSSGRFVGSATNNAYFGCSGAFGLEFATNNNVRMVVDTSGNVGIGVVPSAVWTANGNLQVGIHAALYTNASLGATDFAYNSIRTGSDTYQYSFATSLAASRLQQRDGSFRFFTAPAGTSPNAIAFTERLRLKETGQLRFVPLAADPAGAEAGDVYYNSSSNKLKCYNGTTWNDLF